MQVEFPSQSSISAVCMCGPKGYSFVAIFHFGFQMAEVLMARSENDEGKSHL